MGKVDNMAKVIGLKEVHGRLRHLSQYALDADHGIELGHLADAIDANLAQPAQAVDVGAIREVINYLQDEGNACIATGDGLDAQWGSRILSMSRKLTRAIGNASTTK